MMYRCEGAGGGGNFYARDGCAFGLRKMCLGLTGQTMSFPVLPYILFMLCQLYVHGFFFFICAITLAQNSISITFSISSTIERMIRGIRVRMLLKPYHVCIDRVGFVNVWANQNELQRNILGARGI